MKFFVYFNGYNHAHYGAIMYGFKEFDTIDEALECRKQILSIDSKAKITIVQGKKVSEDL